MCVHVTEEDTLYNVFQFQDSNTAKVNRLITSKVVLFLLPEEHGADQHVNVV